MQPRTTASKKRRVHGVLPRGMMQKRALSISSTYLMMGGIRRNQTPSDAISSTYLMMGGIRRHQTPSDAIRRHQTQSDAIRRHPRASGSSADRLDLRPEKMKP